MPNVISNTVFCVDANGQFVQNSVPNDRIYRNAMNSNVFWVVTPLALDTVVKLSFAVTNLTKVSKSVVASPATDVSPSVLISSSEPYYDYVASWNVFKCVLPSEVSAILPITSTGTVGFMITLTSSIPNTLNGYYNSGNITTPSQALKFFEGQPAFYTCKIPLYNYALGSITLTYGDIISYDGTENYTRIPSRNTRVSTTPITFYGNPALENRNFEDVEVGDTSLLDGIVQAIGNLNNDIINLEENFDSYYDKPSIDRFFSDYSTTREIEVILEDYYTKLETDTIFEEYYTRVDIDGIIAGYYTTGQVDTMLANYLDATEVQDLLDTEKAERGAGDASLSNRIDSANASVSALDAVTEKKINKGAPNGYAPLDINAKIPVQYIDDIFLGQLVYAGTFDPNEGYPTETNALDPNRPVQYRDFFFAAVAGTIGSISYNVGDWAVKGSGVDEWQLVPNTDAVASVNGKIGIVVLNGTDIQMGNGDTTNLTDNIVNKLGKDETTHFTGNLTFDNPIWIANNAGALVFESDNPKHHTVLSREAPTGRLVLLNGLAGKVSNVATDREIAAEAQIRANADTQLQANIDAANRLTVETWNTVEKTLTLSDANKLFTCAHTANQILTIPTNENVSFPIGTMITFLLESAYTVTFVGESGVTLTSIDSLVVLSTQYGMASLIKISADTWQLVGALT